MWDLWLSVSKQVGRVLIGIFFLILRKQFFRAGTHTNDSLYTLGNRHVEYVHILRLQMINVSLSQSWSLRHKHGVTSVGMGIGYKSINHRVAPKRPHQGESRKRSLFTRFEICGCLLYQFIAR